jgi:16S rRNA processing protein RimM
VTTSADDDFLVVGRIGKAHGIKGEVSVEPRTDDPARRFKVGSVLATRSTRPGPAPSATLTIETIRWHQDRLLMRFVEIPDRNAAEASRGTQLVVPIDPTEVPDDPEEFYDHQLIGLRAEKADGSLIGEVSEVVHGAAQDLLVIHTSTREVLIPFVSALVPLVDVPAGRLVVDDRPGLLDELPDEPADR